MAEVAGRDNGRRTIRRPLRRCESIRSYLRFRSNDGAARVRATCRSAKCGLRYLRRCGTIVELRHQQELGASRRVCLPDQVHELQQLHRSINQRYRRRFTN